MRFSPFIYIARSIVLSQQIAAQRRAYKQHPTHTPNSHGRALQELSRGIAGMDRHLARRMATDPSRSLTRRLRAWSAGL